MKYIWKKPKEAGNGDLVFLVLIAIVVGILAALLVQAYPHIRPAIEWLFSGGGR